MSNDLERRRRPTMINAIAQLIPTPTAPAAVAASFGMTSLMTIHTTGPSPRLKAITKATIATADRAGIDMLIPSARKRAAIDIMPDEKRRISRDPNRCGM